ncbi:MAG: hypothetical protein K8I29_08255 [Alphaproteobacteria bacterium]|uniref:Uncharacterized protein n=1 Tax=Candidatus Nitrobium versatile TaxID=2884831 RepID=A0A953LZY3_9BACT|nr:hypothetical protein [Candidatus Nitrobium versatile]
MRKSTLLCIAVLLLFQIAPGEAYVLTPDVSLSLSGEYNDNLFLRNTDRESDFITRLSPGIRFSLHSMRSTLQLAYSPDLNYYSSHTDLSNIAHKVFARGSFALSERMNLTIEDTFLLSEETGDLVTLSVTGPLRERREWRVNTLESRIAYRTGGAVTCLLRAAYSDYDRKGTGLSEVKTYRGTGEISYAVSERSTLSVYTRHIKYDYRPGSDAYSQEYTLGISHKLTRTLRLEAQGGVLLSRMEEDGSREAGFSGGGLLSKRFGKGSALLSFQQTIIAGVDDGEPLRTRTIDLTLSRPLSPRWTASFSGSYGTFKSIRDTRVDTGAFRLTPSVAYTLTPRTDIALSYRYLTTHDRIADARDYRVHTATLSLRWNYSAGQQASFPFPMIQEK